MNEAPASDPVADEPREEPDAALALRRLNDLLGGLETAAGIGLVAMLIGAAVFQVVAGLVGVHDTWPYEVIRYGVFFVAMAGAALAAQRQGMFNMDLVTRLFPPRYRSILRILIAVLIVAMCALVIRVGVTLRAGTLAVNEDHEVISAAMGYLSLIIGFALIAIHYAIHAAIEVVHLANRRLPPEPPHGGH